MRLPLLPALVLLDPVKNLIDLYQAQGQKDQEEEWRARLPRK